MNGLLLPNIYRVVASMEAESIDLDGYFGDPSGILVS
jgi:hypothetical protein